MVLLLLSLAIVLLSTACAVSSALGRAPLWVAVLLWCIAALTSAMFMPLTSPSPAPSAAPPSSASSAPRPLSAPPPTWCVCAPEPA